VWINQSEASIVLYSGYAPTAGKRFGTIPSDTCAAKEAMTCHVTSNRSVTRQRPGNEVKVSRPQSVNQGYPAITGCCGPRSERYISAAHQSSPTKESSAGAACRAVSRRDFSRFARAATSSRSMVSLVRAKAVVDLARIIHEGSSRKRADAKRGGHSEA